MKQNILKYAVMLFAAMVLTGCSLLKVSVGTGDPLPREQVRTRMITRGFYYDMTSEIARAADSIVVAAPDVQVQIRAIRWKMQATRAAVEAAMQSIPDVALADTWILCRRMHTDFVSTPDSLLFGTQSAVAREVASRLEERVRGLAHDVLPQERYMLMERFVDQYVAASPSSGEVVAANTTLAWLEFLKANGIDEIYAAGSISEVIADMGDKVGGQTRQLTNTLGWSKDIFELQMQQDSIRTRLEGQLDSLERNFSRMVTVVEHLPQISDHVIGTFNIQVQQMIGAMDAAMDDAFGNLDRQRAELQGFIGQERAAIMDDMSEVAGSAVQTLLDGLPAVVGRVVFWLILLMVVVIGLPFAAGFWVGSLRERMRGRKKPE